MIDEIIKKEIDQSLVETTPINAPHGLGIAGLEEEDVSILPIPFVRVVQGQSKDIQTKDDKEAKEGTFFFNDTKEVLPSLVFVILKSKVVTVDFERDGKIIPTKQRKILGMTMDTKKLFILSLAISSFSNYGRLIAEMKQKKVIAVWDYMVTATTRKTENEKGKFYVIEFALGEAINEQDKQEMKLSFEQYKNIFEKKDDIPF